MPKRFTVSGRVPFDIQVIAEDEEEAKKRWHSALAAVSNPPLPQVRGLEMAFFTDEGESDDLFVDPVEAGTYDDEEEEGEANG